MFFSLVFHPASVFWIFSPKSVAKVKWSAWLALSRTDTEKKKILGAIKRDKTGLETGTDNFFLQRKASSHFFGSQLGLEGLAEMTLT